MLWFQLMTTIRSYFKQNKRKNFTSILELFIKMMILNSIYWIVRKVRADFEGKLKRRRFKFLISFIKFKSFAARIFRTTQY